MQAVLAAGGLPLTLPMYDPALYPDGAAEQLEQCDGLLLSAGNADVSPATYGRPHHPELGVPPPTATPTSSRCSPRPVAAASGVLGMCRGIQVVNVAYGGTLYQDLPASSLRRSPRRADAPRLEPHHEVAVAEGSRLYEAVGASIGVTSFHHQAVKGPRTGLIAVAVAPDGLSRLSRRPTSGGSWLSSGPPRSAASPMCRARGCSPTFVAQCGADT